MEAKLCDLACLKGLSLWRLARAEVTCLGTWVTRPSASTVISPRLPRLSADPAACLVRTTPTLRRRWDNCHVLQTLPVRSVEPRPLRIACYGRVTDHPPVTQIFLAWLTRVIWEETCNKITQVLMLWLSRIQQKLDQRARRASSNPSLSKQIGRGCKGEKGFYITACTTLLHK